MTLLFNICLRLGWRATFASFCLLCPNIAVCFVSWVVCVLCLFCSIGCLVVFVMFVLVCHQVYFFTRLFSCSTLLTGLFVFVCFVCR